MNIQEVRLIPQCAAGEICDWHEARRALILELWNHAMGAGNLLCEAQREVSPILLADSLKELCNISTYEVLAYRNFACGVHLLDEASERAAALGPEQAKEFEQAQMESDRGRALAFRKWAMIDGAAIDATLRQCRAILNRPDATLSEIAEVARLASGATYRAQAALIGC